MSRTTLLKKRLKMSETSTGSTTVYVYFKCFDYILINVVGRFSTLNNYYKAVICQCEWK